MTRAQQAGLRVEDLPRPSLRTLVRRHKLDAPIRAAQRADGLLNGGDMDGAAVWRRILEAIEELTRGRRDGEAVN